MMILVTETSGDDLEDGNHRLALSHLLGSLGRGDPGDPPADRRWFCRMLPSGDVKIATEHMAIGRVSFPIGRVSFPIEHAGSFHGHVTCFLPGQSM